MSIKELSNNLCNVFYWKKFFNERLPVLELKLGETDNKYVLFFNNGTIFVIKNLLKKILCL